MVFYGYTPHFSLLLKNSCFLFSSALRLRRSFFHQPRSVSALSPRRPRAADTVYILHYRHRYPVHGTGYASLFLNPCASVYTQLGQSCSAATRLSLHWGAFSWKWCFWPKMAKIAEPPNYTAAPAQ